MEDGFDAKPFPMWDQPRQQIADKTSRDVASTLSGKTVFVYDDAFLSYDFGPSHPLRPVRLRLAAELARSTGLLEQPNVLLAKPRMADTEQVLLFHTRDYVDLVERLSRTGEGLLDLGDTPSFKGCFESSKLYVGGSILAADLLMEKKADHAFNPAGGLHHAHLGAASGFCIFNDPAIVVAYLKHRYQVKKMLYLDVDAHHGDGVMYGFYSDPSLLNIDFHQDGRYLFPGTGFPREMGEGQARGLKVNVPLLPRTGDVSYLRAFREIVPRMAKAFGPEVILMQCGADSHFDDRLANLGLTTSCYEQMGEMVHSLAHELCDGRVLLFGGGGYSLSSVARCWTLAFSKLAETQLEDQIPNSWREQYEKASGETAPIRLRDSEAEAIPEPEICAENVERVLRELKAVVPMLRRNDPRVGMSSKALFSS